MQKENLGAHARSPLGTRTPSPLAGKAAPAAALGRKQQVCGRGCCLSGGLLVSLPAGSSWQVGMCTCGRSPGGQHVGTQKTATGHLWEDPGLVTNFSFYNSWQWENRVLM